MSSSPNYPKKGDIFILSWDNDTKLGLVRLTEDIVWPDQQVKLEVLLDGSGSRKQDYWDTPAEMCLPGHARVTATPIDAEQFAKDIGLNIQYEQDTHDLLAALKRSNTFVTGAGFTGFSQAPSNTVSGSSSP